MNCVASRANWLSGIFKPAKLLLAIFEVLVNGFLLH
jgi:hypothetical protein